MVPCGIFDDPAFAAEIKEACATIRKAMVQITELGTSTPAALNQSTRWVMTKEEHCGKIISKVAEYGLCQRVKNDGTVFASPEDYVEALKAHHAVMQAAMKAKQTVDVAGADARGPTPSPTSPRCTSSDGTRAAGRRDERGCEGAVRGKAHREGVSCRACVVVLDDMHTQRPTSTRKRHPATETTVVPTAVFSSYTTAPADEKPDELPLRAAVRRRGGDRECVAGRAAGVCDGRGADGALWRGRR